MAYFIYSMEKNSFEFIMILLAAMVAISFVCVIYIQHLLSVQKENQMKLNSLIEEIVFRLDQREQLQRIYHKNGERI